MENNFDWKQMIIQVFIVAVTAGSAFFVKEYVNTVDWKQAWDVAKGWLAWGAVGGFGLNRIVSSVNKTS